MGLKDALEAKHGQANEIPATNQNAGSSQTYVSPVSSAVLEREIEFITNSRLIAFSAAEYQYMGLPTLAELRQAYFGKNPEGSWAHPEYRNSVLSKRGYGEWTCTFLQDGKRAIENPQRIYYDSNHKLWQIGGGKITPVEIPPNGWILEFDKPTGFPSKTSKSKEASEKVFGDDASYFYRNTRGVRAVLRAFLAGEHGPFCVSAVHEAGDRGSSVGGRACRRSEQDAQRLAAPIELTPQVLTVSGEGGAVYVMNQEEYNSLLAKYKEIADLLSRIKAQK